MCVQVGTAVDASKYVRDLWMPSITVISEFLKKEVPKCTQLSQQVESSIRFLKVMSSKLKSSMYSPVSMLLLTRLS